MNKRYKATIALGISICGAGATLPLTNGFFGSLINSGFIAASIGGLADWFAVTALFRKPLGISYRTEIILRNRQRIMDELNDFIAHDVLSSEHIKGFIDKQNLSNFVLDFLLNSGREKLLLSAGKIIQTSLESIDVEHVKQDLVPEIHKAAAGIFTEKTTEAVLDKFGNDKMAGHVLMLLTAGGRRLLDDEGLMDALHARMAKLLQDYEGEGAGRGFIMGLIGLDADRLMGILKNRALKYLDQLEDDPELQERAKAWLSEQMVKLGKNESVYNSLAAMLQEYANSPQTDELVEAGIIQFKNRSAAITAQFLGYVNKMMDKFTTDAKWQHELDMFLKGWLENEITSRHHIISNMISDRLNQLSDEKLVEFAEEKVADDLQMIRINGSVVGGIAGMLLFIVTFLAGQVFRP